MKHLVIMALCLAAAPVSDDRSTYNSYWNSRLHAVAGSEYAAEAQACLGYSAETAPASCANRFLDYLSRNGVTFMPEVAPPAENITGNTPSCVVCCPPTIPASQAAKQAMLLDHCAAACGGPGKMQSFDGHDERGILCLCKH